MALKHQAYLLPILIAIWFPLAFVITYLVAVLNDDVEPIFPFISDTGTWSPESCIFGLFLNVGAFIQIAIIYIRYRQVRLVTEKHSFKDSIKTLNRLSMVLGVIAASGVCLVGNFQETNVLLVHMAGAMAAFGLGSVYQCIQTRISFFLFPILGNRKVNITRVCVSLISCVSFIITTVYGTMFSAETDGVIDTKLTKDDIGFNNHLISAITEWILALSTMFYLLLFTFEFKRITIEEPLFVEVV